MKDSLPVCVLADYKPTKNFLQCQKNNPANESYGDMAYQKEEKLPAQMLEEGWCDDCTGSYYHCKLEGKCAGYGGTDETLV
jgi:hypothetical protein